MGTEHAGERIVAERIDGVQRLGCGWGGERDELARTVEPKQRIREIVGVAGSGRVGVGGQLALGEAAGA